MEQICVGIIGCGNICKKHLDSIKSIEACKIIAVADINFDRAKRIAQEARCVAYENAMEMLAKETLDVVHICLPHYLHAQYAIASMQHGCHVIIEKPIATTLSDGIKIQDTSRATGKKAMVIYQNRFTPATIKAKELIYTEHLGQVKGINGIVLWRRDSQYYMESSWRGDKLQAGGGAIITQAIHTLDLMEFIYRPFVKVRCTITQIGHDGLMVEDSAYAILEYETGVRSNLFVTTSAPTNEYAQITVLCTYGKIQLSGNSLFICKGNQIRNVIGDVTEGTSKQSVCYGSGHLEQISRFYENIEAASDIVPLNDAIHSLDVVLKLYESAACNHTINL